MELKFPFSLVFLLVASTIPPIGGGGGRKLFKHDEALKELINSEAPERVSSTLTASASCHLRARGSKKSWTEKMSLGNGEVMELKLNKHDEAVKDFAGQLNEF